MTMINVFCVDNNFDFTHSKLLCIHVGIINRLIDFNRVHSVCLGYVLLEEDLKKGGHLKCKYKSHLQYGTKTIFKNMCAVYLMCLHEVLWLRDNMLMCNS